MLLKRPAGPLRAFRFDTWPLRLRVGLVVAMAIAGVMTYRGRDAIGAFVSLQTHIVANFVKSLSVRPDRLTIDIKHKDFMKLAFKRQKALDAGVLIAEPDDFVPATITFKKRKVRVKLRLKGDRTDHLEGEKWSYRVVVRKDDTLFGMKRFSLQHPRARSYVHEWFLHRVMGREGLISLRYGFVDVVLNGKALGVYAVEEHFERRLIENNRRREGPIVYFSEEADIKRYPRSLRGGVRTDIYGAEIDVYRHTATFGDETLSRQFLVAKNLLESFRAGKARTCDVFDCGQLAKYSALIDLLGAHHIAKYGNFKLYYNPVTSLLEPIVFDSEQSMMLGPKMSPVLAEDWFLDPFMEPFSLLFQDPRLFRAYMDELAAYSDPAFLDDVFDELGEEMERNLRIIYRETPRFKFGATYFYQRQDFIREILNPPVGIIPYFKEIRDGPRGRIVEFETGNMVSFPLIIKGLHGDGFDLAPLDESEAKISYSVRGRPITVQRVRFAWPDSVPWNGDAVPAMEISFATWSTGPSIRRRVLPWPRLDARLGINDLSRPVSDLEDLAFLTVEAGTRTIRFRPGRWRIVESLVLPPGYLVVADGGVELDLAQGAMIVSYSPLRFTGRAANPISITSEDGTGEGLAVIKAGGTSRLEHVVFRNLRNPSRNGWALTGAVTFYESPVDIVGGGFFANPAEDALNIIRSRFTLADTEFEDAFSDAVDIDFSTGTITGSSFTRSGNDAMDFSGSDVEVRNVVIRGSGDKGISVGERSRVSVESVSIRNARIGVASKDRSELLAKTLKIADGEIGIAVYQKKSEFGPSRAVVVGAELSAIGTPFLVEEGSSLQFNARDIPADSRRVEEGLYGDRPAK